MYDKRRWLAVAAVGLSIFLSALDASIVALALPVIGHRFQISDSLTSVVILSYAIALTVLILPCGEIIGRFRVLPTFLVAVLGFGLGSCLCGLAVNFPLLIVGRVIQGCFGALIATQGLAIAATVVAPHERGRAMGLIGSLAPLGGVAGPGIGGQILAHWDWSAIFFVNVPLCLLAALLGLLSLGKVSLALRHAGSGSALRQMGSLLHRPAFGWGLVGFLGMITVASALYYLLPFDLAGIQHLSPSTAGVILLGMPLGMGLVGLLGGYLTDRFGAKPFTLLGSGLVLVGLGLLALDIVHPVPAPDFAWRLLIVGIGMGLFNGPNQTLLMSAGARESVGAASALSNLSARLGSVFGPLMLSILWTFLPNNALHMGTGMLVLILLGTLILCCAWLVRPGTDHVSAGNYATFAKKERT